MEAFFLFGGSSSPGSRHLRTVDILLGGLNHHAANPALHSKGDWGKKEKKYFSKPSIPQKNDLPNLGLTGDERSISLPEDAEQSLK